MYRAPRGRFHPKHVQKRSEEIFRFESRVSERKDGHQAIKPQNSVASANQTRKEKHVKCRNAANPGRHNHALPLKPPPYRERRAES